MNPAVPPRMPGLAVALFAAFQAGCGNTVADSPPSAAGPGGDRGVLSFTMKTIDGVDRPLSAYKGRVLLIVNVASRCGYTPQYEGLEALFRKYRGRGFMVLGFPANNFLGQEPGTDGDIAAFCRTTYGVTFDMFAKISVAGSDIHPLYDELTTRSPVPGRITWNFNKFLVDRQGRVVARFGSAVKPDAPELVSRLEALLAR